MKKILITILILLPLNAYAYSPFLELPLLGSTDTQVYSYDNMYKKKSFPTTTLQKSINNGDSWSDVYTFTNGVSQIIEVDNGNLIVTTKDGSIFADPPAEVFVSTTSGATFTKMFDFESGGTASWSFDSRGNTVFLAEYGKYPATKLYRSTDGGLNWTTVFTHPNPGDGDTHLHKVHIDNYDVDKIYLSAGDTVAVRGVWYSPDNGDNWTKAINTPHQPTWIETTEDYVFLFEDLEASIDRINKADLFSGTFTVEESFDATTDPYVEMGNISFYSGGVDSKGRIYAGGVAYGENNGSGNNKDAGLFISWNDGDNWRAIKEYDRNAEISSGASFISWINDTSFYIYTNNPTTVEILDTASSSLSQLYESTVTISGIITNN